MYKITAINVSDRIILGRAKNTVGGKIAYSSSSEAFIKIDENKYVTIFQNGVVAFANYEKEEIEKILLNLAEFMVSPQETISENLIVDFHDDDRVYYEDDVLMVPDDLDLTKLLRLVMFDLSQTVAIDQYSAIAESLLQEVENFAVELERTGKISINKTEMNKFIGKSLSTKNKIVTNLYIFDIPDLAWEGEDLEKVHKVLLRTYDLGARIKELQTTFDVIDQNLDKFQGMYQHGHSSKLEWIVIILILIEILKSIGESLKLF